METGTQYAERVRTHFKEPKQYAVVFLNDDFTTMEFVMFVLEKVFYKSQEEAYKLMMDVHVSGKGVAGVYPLDIARSKLARVMELVKAEGAPLRVIIEEA